MRRSRRNHREAIGQFRHPAIDDHRPVVVDHRLDTGIEFILTGNADTLPAISLAQLDEIGQCIGIAV